MVWQLIVLRSGCFRLMTAGRQYNLRQTQVTLLADRRANLLRPVRQGVWLVFLQLDQPFPILILTLQHGPSDGTRLSRWD